MGFMAGFGAAAGGAAQGIQTGMQMGLQRQMIQIQRQRANLEGWNQLNTFINTVDPQTAKTMWPQVSKTFMGADPNDQNAKASYMQWVDGNTQSGAALRTALSSMGDPNSPMNSVVKNIPVQTFASMMKNPQALVQFLGATTQYQLQQSQLKALQSFYQGGGTGMPGPGGAPSQGPGPPGNLPNIAFNGNEGYGILFKNESGGKGNAVNVNKDGSAPTSSGYPRSYFQITDGTWKQFAPVAGINVQQYPNAGAAPFDIQKQVADQIPVNRWAPTTVASLVQKYPGLNTSMTLGQVANRFNWDQDNGRPVQQLASGQAGYGIPPQQTQTAAAPPQGQPPTQTAAAPPTQTAPPSQTTPPPQPTAPTTGAPPQQVAAAPPPVTDASQPPGPTAPSTGGNAPPTSQPATVATNQSGGTTTTNVTPPRTAVPAPPGNAGYPPGQQGPTANMTPPQGQPVDVSPTTGISSALQNRIDTMRANGNRMVQIAPLLGQAGPAMAQAGHAYIDEANQMEQNAIRAGGVAAQTLTATVAAQREAREAAAQQGWADVGQPGIDGTIVQHNSTTNEYRLFNPTPWRQKAIEDQITKYDNPTLAGIRSEGNQAYYAMQDLNTIQAIDQARVAKVGLGAETLAEANKLADKLGLGYQFKGVFGQPGYSEALDMLSAKLKQSMITRARSDAGSQLGSGFNPTSNMISSEMVPELNDTENGRAMIVGLLKSYYQHQLDISQIANQHGNVLSQPDQSGKSFYQKMDQYKANTPPVPSWVSDKLEQATGQAGGASGATQNLPLVTSGDAAAAAHYSPPQMRPTNPAPNAPSNAPPLPTGQNPYAGMNKQQFLQEYNRRHPAGGP